jgi:ATP synthase F1 gamma subunit
MQNSNKVVKDIEFTSTLKLLAKAYEEISVIKMQRVKSSVLTTREFIEDLNQVFVDVRSSYEAQIKGMMNKNKKSKNQLSFSTQRKNGKEVLVFIAADEKLYGDIVKKVFHLFTFYLKQRQDKEQPVDIVIVGKYGKELFDSLHNNLAYTYIEIPDTYVKLTDLKPIIDIIADYETVNVFYGKFGNVVNQEATATDVTGAPFLGLEQKIDKKIHYFFEPSLQEILRFFETQVFASLFQQTMHESELSRLASRIKAMEDALSNIDRSEIQLKGQQRRLKKLHQNRKQLETMSGIKLWKK